MARCHTEGSKTPHDTAAFRRARYQSCFIPAPLPTLVYRHIIAYWVEKFKWSRRNIQVMTECTRKHTKSGIAVSLKLSVSGTNPGRKCPVNCVVQRPRSAGNILTLPDTLTGLKRDFCRCRKQDGCVFHLSCY
jgi:hypothetical protein